jgi:hypothetical protein
MTTKEYLRQARTLKISINGKLSRIRQMRDFTTRATSQIKSDPVRGGNSKGFAAISDCIVDFEREIIDDLQKLYTVQSDIQASINQVSDVRYRTLLELYYLNGYTWEEVANEIGYAIRQTYRLHGEALQSFKKHGTEWQSEK